MHLIQIPPEAAVNIWPLAAPMLARAIAYTNGATTLEKELAAVVTAQKQLWMIVDDSRPELKPVAACVSWLQINADGSKTANIELVGGENMKAWVSLREDFENWAGTEGCKDVRLWARKGWVKYMPDFKLTHYILRKDIA